MVAWPRVCVVPPTGVNLFRTMPIPTGSTGNWITMAESRFPWERDALEFVRERFPAHEPYRAWTNLEFVADDGSINEVDLLAFTPQGFFLVEIKSPPGRLLGDSGTWLWETDGRGRMVDNPLFSANAKAKRLRSLLQNQAAFRSRGQVPFVEHLVFCSHPDLQCDLSETGRMRVCLRDREEDRERPARAGIMAALRRRDCFGLDLKVKGDHSSAMLRVVNQALDQAGIRPSQRVRRVGDHQLKLLLHDGPGYQDWEATHAQMEEVRRRVRIYPVRLQASPEDRETVRRAALREFQLLEKLAHPGILRAYHLSEHDLGLALVLEHDPHMERLDHFLARRKDSLPLDLSLDLMRQVAEAIRFAHEQRVVHRALCPQSILVTGASGSAPRVKLFNWQVGFRRDGSVSGEPRGLTATSHADRFLDEAGPAYFAPEAFTSTGDFGELADVFSLGALAYHLFAHTPPAASALELGARLRETGGLRISAVLNGAPETLQNLIFESTQPEVPRRLESAAEFLRRLDAVEEELTRPEQDPVADPCRAKTGDCLSGGYVVVRRLGQGASAVALLVEKDDQKYVLKVANSPEHNERLRDEAEVLEKLRHDRIVECRGTLELGDRTAILMRPVLVNDKDVETLRDRLRSDGRLQLDLLERFGEDLLRAVNHLEEQGIPHRDIKPDNIALGKVGPGDRLHLVLFDFSLSRAPADQIRAGTTGYLDPLLPLRKPPRWDLHAERYAAAVTLYEAATGALPRWGDGISDPAQLHCEITLDAELFDAGLGDSLLPFFRRAFRRDPAERFDNAEGMLRDWRACIERIGQPGTLSEETDAQDFRTLAAAATLDTKLVDLSLGTRAMNALDRANILTVGELLAAPAARLQRLRGVGQKTRKEIREAVRLLRQHLQVSPAVEDGPASEPDPLGVLPVSVDFLYQRSAVPGARDGDGARRAIEALLGFHPDLTDPWPSQSDVARSLGMTPGRIAHLVAPVQKRWSRDRAVTRLRDDVTALLAEQGGVMTPAELAEAVLMARGCVQEEPLRTRRGIAVARIAAEVERSMSSPRFQVRRDEDRVFVALTGDLADYAVRLGNAADELAAEDPLLSSTRALERLRRVPLPPGSASAPPTDARLLRLSAAASRQAALSSRQEFYPRGMEPLRALKLSQGALLGVRTLTTADIQERVRSRYPEAAPLPGRPALDALLQEVGLALQWKPDAASPVTGETGCYHSVARDFLQITSESRPLSRAATGSAPEPPGEVTPEIADARQFEERLQRGLREGAFLALVAPRRRYREAARELSGRFPLDLEVVDVEGIFLDALRQVAREARVDWDRVIQADAAPGKGDWRRLLQLVGRALPRVEQRLAAAERPLLLTFADLLGRYDCMDLLERLRDRVGRPGGPPGLWLLVPGDQQAMLDGRAVPILSPAQRAPIPDAWLANRHRAG